MPSPPPLLTWDVRFNTGQPDIDSQHQELVRLLNQFAKEVQELKANSSATFDSFTLALRRHFAFEEVFLRKLGTPPNIIEAHAIHHAESLELLKYLGAQLAHDPRDNSAAVLAEILHCLLVDLLDEDRYCFVTMTTNSEDKTSPPVMPALQTFKRMFELLNNNQERISEARDYYLTLLKDFPTPLLRTDKFGRFDWFNNTWLNLTGITLNNATDDGWLNAIHPDDRSEFSVRWQQCFSTQSSFSIDYRLIDVTGELHWIHHFGNPFFDSDGILLGYLCTLFDFTERKKAEDNLRVAATLFEHATDAIMITNASGQIEAINPAFLRLTGYSSKQAIGKSANLLRSGFHTNEFYELIWKRVLAEGTWEGEIVNRRADGELFPVWLSITTILDDNGKIVRMVGVFNDIGSKQTSRKQLMHMAHHDALTGLPNRLLFCARAQHSLERCIREKSKLAILFIDLDGFKPVNDNFGHRTGDRVLCDIATRLGNLLRSEDTVARFGGDEFVVLVERSENIDDARSVAQKLLDAFPLQIIEEGVKLEVSASIGISLYPDDGQTVDDLIDYADKAMYRVKQEKKKPDADSIEPGGA